MRGKSPTLLRTSADYYFEPSSFPLDFVPELTLDDAPEKKGKLQISLTQLTDCKHHWGSELRCGQCLCSPWRDTLLSDKDHDPCFLDSQICDHCGQTRQPPPSEDGIQLTNTKIQNHRDVDNLSFCFLPSQSDTLPILSPLRKKSILNGPENEAIWDDLTNKIPDLLDGPIPLTQWKLAPRYIAQRPILIELCHSTKLTPFNELNIQLIRCHDKQRSQSYSVTEMTTEEAMGVWTTTFDLNQLMATDPLLPIRQEPFKRKKFRLEGNYRFSGGVTIIRGSPRFIIVGGYTCKAY